MAKRRYKKKDETMEIAKVLLGLIVLFAIFSKQIISFLIIVLPIIFIITIVLYFATKEIKQNKKINQYQKFNNYSEPKRTKEEINRIKDIEERSIYNYVPERKKEKNNYQKGKEYEEQIGKYYESLGYHVIYHGIEKGKKDKGIDLIATNHKETLLIQCKNWENSLVKQKHLKEFLWNCDDFIKKNTFRTIDIEKIFITSNNKMDYGVKKFMQENYQSMKYKVIPYLNI